VREAALVSEFGKPESRLQRIHLLLLRLILLPGGPGGYQRILDFAEGVENRLLIVGQRLLRLGFHSMLLESERLRVEERQREAGAGCSEGRHVGKEGSGMWICCAEQARQRNLRKPVGLGGADPCRRGIQRPVGLQDIGAPLEQLGRQSWWN